MEVDDDDALLAAIMGAGPFSMEIDDGAALEQLLDSCEWGDAPEVIHATGWSYSHLSIYRAFFRLKTTCAGWALP